VKVFFYILFFLFGVNCFAQTYTSTGVTSDWNLGTSWDLGNVPATGADVVILTGHTITISGPVTNDAINSLVIQGTGTLSYTGNETITVATSITMSGTSSITGSAGGHRLDAVDFNVTSGSAEIGGIQLNVSGLTTTSASTTLLFSSLTGVKTIQNIAVSGDLNFTANETLEIPGDFEMSGTSAIGGAANGLLNVTGTFTVPSGTATIGGSRLAITSLTTISGNLVFDNSAGFKNFNNFTVNSTGNVNFTANETVSIAGDLEMLGTSSITGSSNSHIVDVTGNFNVPSGTAAIGGIRLAVGSTTTVSGTLEIDNSNGNKTLNHLTISSGQINFTQNETLAVAGDLTMSGTSSITGSSNGFQVPVTGNFTVPSGTATIAGIRLTIDGTTTVAGTLTFTDPVGTKTFTGAVIVTGTWNNTSTSNFTFGGVITNNGTWNGCSDGTSCIYTLTSSTGAINGSGITNISDFQIDGTASITNNGNIVITDNIRGTGTFINGATGNLTLSENGLYDITVLTLNTAGNRVIYGGTTNEVIDLGPFHHLDINMATTADIVQVNGTDVTINGDLTVTQGIFRVNSAHVLSVAQNVLVSANGEFETNSIGATVTVTSGDFTVTSGLFDQNDGVVNISAGDLIIAGTMTINEGATLGASTITATDMSVTAPGDVTLSEGTLTLSNAAGALTVNSGDLLINNAAHTLSIAGGYDINGGASDINAGTLSFVNMDINGGGVINVANPTITSTGLINVVDGTLTIDGAAGTHDYNNLTVGVSGTWNNTTTSNFTFGGDIANNGTWNGCSDGTSCIYTLTSSTGAINGSGTTNISDLQIDGTAAITNNGNIVMTDNIRGTGTFINGATGNLTLSENGLYDITSLNLTTSGNTVIYAGTTNEVIDIGPFHHLTINMASGTPIVQVNGTDVTAAGDFTVTEGDFRVNSNQLTISGDYDINGGSSDLNTVTVSFTNMDMTGGTINVGNTIITSTGLINIAGGTFTVDGAAGTHAYNNLTVAASGTWNVTAAYSPTFSGDLVNNGTFTGCNGNGCVYTLSNANGSISGSGHMNDMATLNVTNIITNTNTNALGLDITQGLTGAGTFINGASGIMAFGGGNANFTIGTFTASATGNKVIYNRVASNQLLQPTTGNVYYDLEIAKAAGQDLTTNAEITINNQLTLTLGNIILGAQNMVIGPSGSMTSGSTNSYLSANGGGNLRKIFNSIGSFEAMVGGDSYSPITVNLTSGGLTPGTSFIGFDITDAPHPQRNRNNTGDATPGDDDGTAATQFLDVYWTLVGNAITSPVYDATYVYDPADFTQTTESNMVGALYRPLPPGFVTLDWLARGTVNAANNTVSFLNADGFGDLYAMDNTASRLPIVLLSFDAKSFKENVELKWTTAAEINNSFFTIERSQNGVDFVPRLFLDGAGNSNELQKYQVVDSEPILGRSYYRLKQTDFNGQFEYFEIISVVFEGSEQFNFGLKSNPIAQGQSIAIWKTKSLEGFNPHYILRDIQGQVIVQSELPLTMEDNYELPKTERLSSGMYLLSINYLGSTKTVKVLVK
jgi:hypothetical protein